MAGMAGGSQVQCQPGQGSVAGLEAGIGPASASHWGDQDTARVPLQLKGL